MSQKFQCDDTEVDISNWYEGKYMGQYFEMHPCSVQMRLPRLRYDEPDDLLLIPTCPCCGLGRTIHIHAQQNPPIIAEPSFRDWCRSCRGKVADKIEQIDQRQKELWK